MKKMSIVCMMALCLTIKGLSSPIIINRLDFYLDLPEQEAKHLREDFKDKKKLRECLEKGGLLSIRTAEPGKMLKIKERFDVNDKVMQVVLMDIIREASMKTGWKEPLNYSRDTYVAYWILHGAITWLGVCADAEGKQFLMNVITDNTKDVFFRKRAIESYLYRTDAQEMQDKLTRFLVGDMQVEPYDTYLFVVQTLYDVSENDAQKREAIASTVSVTLAKEENKDIFVTVDKLFAKRSKNYADSPQRKAALQRFNIPTEKETP